MIDALGGPTAAVVQLGVSAPTLARWRRLGRIEKARDVLTAVALVESTATAQLELARALAGLE